MPTPLRVLIIEDNEDDALLLLAELRRGGYAPDSHRVQTLAELTAALTGSWDIALADFSLPGFSGPAAVDTIRSSALDLPVIMVSGSVGEETAVDAMLAGARDFVPKGNLRRLVPAVRRELREAVSRAERRRAEEALRQSEATLRSFYSNAPTPMGIVELVDDDILHLYDNDATARFLGGQPGGTEGRLATELGASPRIIDLWRRHYIESEAANAPVHFEYESPWDDGSRWLSVTVSPIGPASSGRTQFCYVAEDVTERRRAEAALRASESRYKLLVERVPTVTYVAAADEHSSTLYISPQIEHLLGYPASYWIEDPHAFADHVHPDDRARVLHAFLETCRNAAPLSVEYRFRARSGEYVWFRDEARFLADGRGGGVVHGVMIDITDARQAQARLAERERRFRSLIENATDLVTLVDEDGFVLYDSPAIERVLGFRPDERVGALCFNVVHPDDLAATAVTFGHALTLTGPTETVQYRALARDGTIRVLESTGTNLLGDPAVAAVVINTRDVTDAVTARGALEQRTHELGERVKEMNCLYAVSRLVHDEARDDATMFPDLLAALCDGMQVPGLATASLLLEGVEYRTRGFSPTEWSMAEEIRLDGAVLGRIVVAYEHHPQTLEVILPEEQQLLRTIADQIGDMLRRRRADTERRRAMDRIRFQAGLLDAVGEAVTATDADGTVIYWNRAAARLFGWTEAEILGRLAPDLAIARMGSARVNAIVADLVAGRGWTGEMMLRRNDDREFPGLVSVAPIQGEDGALIAVVATATDISERREAEQRLAESEERLRCLFEFNPLGILGMDSDGRFTIANDATRQLTGYDSAELLAMRITDFVASAHLHEARSVLADALRGVARTFELDLVLKGGRTRRFHGVVTPIRLRSQITGAYCMLEDISDRQTLEEQLRQSQKMEAVGRLAGGVAHDFNNLLTSIMSSATFLLDDIPENDPRRPDVDEILRASDRAAGLTRQLLAFSRKQVLQPRVIDLRSVVAEMEKMLRRLIGEDVQLLTSCGSEPAFVKADSGQIEQVLLNLSVNARDAMPGGGSLRVDISAVDIGPHDATLAPGSYVRLQVADTGTGMADDVMPHIFEPFFTTKGPGQGTGLGLSTVYGIIIQSGGDIRVDSAPGAGTTFSIYLPRLASGGEPESRRPVTPARTRENGTILLVEDAADVRKLARRTLEGRGYIVREAEDGAAAIALIARDQDPIDLLLTDVIMPRMGGPELAQRFAELRPGTPVLFMSGYTDEAIASRGILDAGVNLLLKPFTPDSLLSRVHQCLRREKEPAPLP